MDQELAEISGRLEDLILLVGYHLIGWVLSMAIQSSLNPIVRPPPRELYRMAERALEILAKYCHDPELARISQLLERYKELSLR